VVVFQASRSVVDQVVRYDDVLDCVGGALTNTDRESMLMSLGGNGTQCVLDIQIEKDMKAPTYIYYELHNYYQNHRRYVKSRSDTQLRNEQSGGGLLDSLGVGGSNDLKDCEPQRTRTLPNGTKLDINPCGLIAWSFFNDTYSFSRQPQADQPDAPNAFEALEVDESGIAWPSDRTKKFSHYTPQHLNDEPATRGGGAVTGYLDENEHLIVWMRTAALPTFRKLWGKLHMDLHAGDTIRVQITNRYNTYRFDGKKKLVLSTTSWLGGRNDFLGIAYMVVGCLCVLLGALFLGICLRNPRPLGDPSFLSWNKRQD